MQKSNPSYSEDPSPNQEYCLEEQLQRKFQEAINHHKSMTEDQAFYYEASKMHAIYVQLQRKVSTARLEVDELREMLRREQDQNYPNKSNKKYQNNDSKDSTHRKRQRRTAVEIARHYICNVDKCNKSYGSQGSLHQHMKLKHESYYIKHLLMLNIADPTVN